MRRFPVIPCSRLSIVSAAVAGVIAGMVATLAQLLLWALASLSPFMMLLRDSRLAAAVLLGPGVLPPPLDWNWSVMIAASLLHLLLSVLYGILLAPLALLPRVSSALLAGSMFGLLLYLVNMHGFTLLFPWFAASRDWITLSAHLVFGISGVAAYRYCEAWRRRVQ